MRVLDLFAGKAGVGASCRRLGFAADSYEIERGLEYDVTSPSNLRHFENLMRRRKIKAVMLGTPCTSFSIARDRTAVIRTRGEPWGVKLVSDKDRERLELGNKCARATIRILKLCLKYHVPAILENPFSSKLWYLPFMVHVLRSGQAELVRGDFCQFGTRWRKATGFLCINLPHDKVTQQLHHTCSGTRGFCSATDERHIQLTGSAPSGVPWTKIAQPYPTKLCMSLARLLVGKC